MCLALDAPGWVHRLIGVQVSTQRCARGRRYDARPGCGVTPGEDLYAGTVPAARATPCAPRQMSWTAGWRGPSRHCCKRSAPCWLSSRCRCWCSPRMERRADASRAGRGCECLGRVGVCGQPCARAGASGAGAGSACAGGRCTEIPARRAARNATPREMLAVQFLLLDDGQRAPCRHNSMAASLPWPEHCMTHCQRR